MIKASVILATACCIAWFLRRRAASERHIVWAAAIIAAAVLPIFTLLLPSWEPVLAQRVAAALPAISSSSTNQNQSGRAQVMFHTDGIETTMVARIWPIVWFAGSLLGGLIFAMGILQQRWLARRSATLFDPALAGITADLVRQAGFRRKVYLKRSLDQPMPMTWGVFRPQILLPNCLDEWCEERKRVVVAHELAHVQRLDWLFQTIAQIACVVYWFNPLFWIACNRLYRESEHACDDIVIGLGVDARDYASHLLGIARTLRQSGGGWSRTLAMARQSTLEKRFAALLKSSPNRRAVTRASAVTTATVTLLLVLPLAAMRVTGPIDIPARLDVIPRVDQYTTPPLYSDEARARGIEGIVTVEVRVGVDGVAKRLQVVKGLGHGLDENALVAVRDWRFVPAQRNGVAMEAVTEIDVEFSLRNAELNEEIANDMATRVGPGVSPPQVVHRVEPQFPAAEDKTKATGVVVLDAVIQEDGIPRIVRVIRSLDWERDETAINALKQWRFSPATMDGRPVKVRMNVAVQFPD
jgi:TonB family protein